MADREVTERRQRRSNRMRKLLAGVALLAAFGVLATMVGAVLMQFFGGNTASAPAPTSARPTLTTPAGPPIKPLQIRPVLSPPLQVTPQHPCPPPAPPPPPTAPLTACDLVKAGVYQLGPEGATLTPTAVDVVPGTGGFFAIRLTMDQSSADTLAVYSSAHVNAQLAFVRDTIVVSAPMITQPIRSRAIELSGNLTRAQADEMAAMLRQPA
ncbi:hypothetical protein LV457_14720 [Mycobacterium sp. MYCO198283]|uniref:SecDF P1 head subdomain-containing protein n=1 Tax=Mycobacterium sp. MYCO198283 TaxID=2883505 RepID=UPI001E4E5E64|nr:hypothetical protein [Mycobacterium sp. MYCO198283]MCG5433531.1 hypothetical protein [Mycobacterium sp. MYCO198283]